MAIFRDLPALTAVDAAALRPADRFGRASLRRALQSPSAIVLAATVAGKTVGFALARRRGRGCWLVGLAVLPQHRRRGLARELVAAMRARCGRLKLAVRADNVGAQRLYDGLGFIANQVRERYYPDGAAGLIFEGPGSISAAKCAIWTKDARDVVPCPRKRTHVHGNHRNGSARSGDKRRGRVAAHHR